MGEDVVHVAHRGVAVGAVVEEGGLAADPAGGEGGLEACGAAADDRDVGV